jgi:very-short-patch-repair endonuclease
MVNKAQRERQGVLPPLPQGEGRGEGVLRFASPAPDGKTLSSARRLRRDSTVPERLLWGVLRGGKVFGLKFRRQHPIPPFVVDFCCESERVVVELDGMSHVGTGVKDDERSAYLAGLGFRVIRVTNDDVIADVVGVAERVGEEILRRRDRGLGIKKELFK